jgi:hypothetical protein
MEWLYTFLLILLGIDQYKLISSIVEKMEKGEIGPKSGKGFFDDEEVNTEMMFNKRYRGFWRCSIWSKIRRTLISRGGIKD